MTAPGRRLGRAALPIVAIAVFGLFVGVALWAAAQAGTLGFDFLAYHQAANRVLAGERVYDPTIHSAGGFGLFYYPPPFILGILPFAPLAPAVAVWAWTVVILAAFALGVAVMPVPSWVRWTTVLLAGLSWPFAYAIKLGQVGPVLFLLFALGWRLMNRPRALGASAAVGALVKIQPGLLLLWAALTRRLSAVAVAVAVALVAAIAATILTGGPATWVDYFAVLRNVSDPITTAHNFTPGAIAWQLGMSLTAAALLQAAVSILVIAALVAATRFAPDDASYLVAVVASQLLSPVLWDHYALMLLLPTAWLLSRGHYWAVVIPLVTSTLLVSISPPVTYPLAFGATLVAVLAAGMAQGRRARSAAAVSEPA